MLDEPRLTASAIRLVSCRAPNLRICNEQEATGERRRKAHGDPAAARAAEEEEPLAGHQRRVRGSRAEDLAIAVCVAGQAAPQRYSEVLRSRWERGWERDRGPRRRRRSTSSRSPKPCELRSRATPSSSPHAKPSAPL